MPFVITNTIQGAAWHRVMDPAVELIDRALTNASTAGARTPSQVAVSKAALAWSAARTAVEQVPAVLEALPDAIVHARINRDLTAEAKGRLVSAVIDGAQAELTRLGDTTRAKIARVDELLRSASMPARPGDTATDEARIAGAKSDLRMVLDAEPADLLALSRRIAELLQRALGDGDAHTAYVLIGTRWPSDYLRTRDRTLADGQIAVVLTEETGAVLDAMTGTDAAAVRRVYRQVVSVDGIWAVEAAIGMLPALLDDVRTWTLRDMGTTSSRF